MLNFSQLRERALPQNLTPKHLLIFVSFIGISLFVHYIAYKLSGAYTVGIVLFALTLFSLCSASLFISHFLDNLQRADSNKKSILLLSHDDELAGQLRYLLPNESITLKWVRTYDNAMSILSKQTTYIFIIDTDNKPKNTATLVELCRSHEHNARRLPIIAIQKEAVTEKKRQLLLEGFDDCLPKPVKQRDVDDFYRRWVNSQQDELSLSSQEKKPDETEVIDNAPTHIAEATPAEVHNDNSNPEHNNSITKTIDKKQALIQSHQSHELAKDMLNMLIIMVKDNQKTLTSLYEEKRWAELGELTHKIKGGCYCSGVPNLQRAVETIDKALEKGQHEQLEQQFKTMMIEIEHLIQWDQEYDLDLIFDDD